jgi:hypothetical protein
MPPLGASVEVAGKLPDNNFACERENMTTPEALQAAIDALARVKAPQRIPTFVSNRLFLQLR